MSLMVCAVKGFKVIRVDGQLVSGEPVNTLRAHIQELLGGDSKHLAIDLTGVNFVDSGGIGALAAISLMAEDAGGECKFFGATSTVMDTLKKVNLHRAIKLFPDQSTALKAA